MRYYWSDGVDTLSMNEICRRTKVSKPVMYREFGNEDGLMQAALAHYYDHVVLQLHRLFTADQTFDNTLDVLVEHGLGAAAAMGYPVGCLFVGMTNAREKIGPATKDEITKTQSKILITYQNWFSQSKARGDFKPDITPEFAAKYLHSQMSNALNQQARGENTEEIKHMLRLALSVLR